MKVVAAALVLLLVLAFGSYKQTQSAVVISCGQAHGGQLAVAKGAEWAEKFGTWVHNVAENPEQYRDPKNVRKAVEGVLKDVLWFWLRSAYLALRGDRPDPEIMRLHDQAAKQAQQARDMCTPCPTVQSGTPLDSLTANSSTGGTSVTTLTPAQQASAAVPGGSDFQPTGSPEEVTRQSAARYFPADQVDTAVAVAQAESSFNPRARNNVQAGMLGLWQINLAAHRNLVGNKDWTDPSVNAWLAYQIWHQAGDSWQPWSTYTSGSYKKYLSDGAAAVERPTEVQGQAPGIGCQSGSMPQARIATWNSNYSIPTDQRVVRGMLYIAKQADVINTQELSNGDRKRKVTDAMKSIGWDVTGTNTSHPIYYDAAKFTLAGHDEQLYYQRGDDIEGLDQGTRYVVSATLRSADGKTFTDINMHQLPHIQDDGTWNKGEPKRRAVALKGWALAMSMAKAAMAQGAVIVEGDMNWDKDPEGMYRGAGLTMVSQVLGSQATLRKREIDQILFSAGAPTSVQNLGRMGSDHEARIVTFPGSSTPTAGVSTAGSRTVKDPASGKTYTIPIPTGPRGVAINFALDQLGEPYVWGGHGPNSWDCSGLVAGAWKKAGVNMTPQTEAMRAQLTTTKTAQPGDLLYHPGHVQMQLPNGLVLEAPRTGLTVRIIEKNWMKPTLIFDPTAGGNA